MRTKNMISRAAGLFLCAVMALGLMAGPMAGTAYADEYTYQATVYAGNHGTFGNALDIRVNNRKSGSGYRIERSGNSKIVISGLKKGDVVSIDVTAPGAVAMDPDSIYYVKGLRDSGMDNSEAGYGAFRVDRDRDFVVAYGMRNRETSYTVYYQTAEGAVLEPAHTYYGNVGDKPVAAYRYIEGYMPLTYNLTKTLSENPAENAMTFIYVPEKGPDVTIRVPGPVIEDHVPGGTVTVNVPGPVIVQNPSPSQSGGQAQDSNGGNQSGGQNPAQDPNGDNGGQSGGQNQAQDPNGDNGGQSGGQNQAQDPNGGNGGQSGGQNQAQGPNGGNGGGQSGTQVDLPGIGGHGSRDDGNGQAGGQEGDGSEPGGQTGTEYKPGGSRDVIISSNYEPSEIVDLDENPSGVPMDEIPDGQDPDGQDPAQGDTPGDAYDEAQDGMNENQDGTGTGNMAPEKSGFPVAIIVVAVVLVLGGAVAAVLVAYKKQQGAGGDGDE